MLIIYLGCGSNIVIFHQNDSNEWESIEKLTKISIYWMKKVQIFSQNIIQWIKSSKYWTKLSFDDQKKLQILSQTNEKSRIWSERIINWMK